jgi:hypothetical protein
MLTQYIAFPVAGHPWGGRWRINNFSAASLLTEPAAVHIIASAVGDISDRRVCSLEQNIAIGPITAIM